MKGTVAGHLAQKLPGPWTGHSRVTGPLPCDAQTPKPASSLWQPSRHPFPLPCHPVPLVDLCFLGFCLLVLLIFMPWGLGFPGSPAGKEPTCSAGDLGSIPGSGRSSGEGIGYPLQYSWAFLVVQLVKNPPAMRETWVQSLSCEDTLEKGTVTHSSILAWRIPWTIQSMVSQRVTPCHNTTDRLSLTHSALGGQVCWPWVSWEAERSAPESLMLAVDVNGYQDSGRTDPPQLREEEVREGFLEEVALS